MTAILDTMAVYGIEHGFRISDPTNMLDFYCDVIGFTPYAEIFVPNGHVWGLRFGNAMLKFLHYPGVDTAPSGNRPSCHYMTIHVLNAEDMLRKCVAAGSGVIAPYATFRPSRPGDPECGYAIVSDPEGNSVEFSQGSPWTAPTDSFRSGRII